MNRRRAVGLAAVAVLLFAAAVVGLVTGVETRMTTGGLLITPMEQVHLHGGRLLAGTAAGTAAVLVALTARSGWRRGVAGDGPGA